MRKIFVVVESVLWFFSSIDFRLAGLLFLQEFHLYQVTSWTFHILNFWLVKFPLPGTKMVFKCPTKGVHNIAGNQIAPKPRTYRI